MFGNPSWFHNGANWGTAPVLYRQVFLSEMFRDQNYGFGLGLEDLVSVLVSALIVCLV